MAQKVIKVGDSLGVTIPKDKARDLKLIAGDEVEVSIRKKLSRADKHEQLLRDLDDFMKTYDQDLKYLAKR